MLRHTSLAPIIGSDACPTFGAHFPHRPAAPEERRDSMGQPIFFSFSILVAVWRIFQRITVPPRPAVAVAAAATTTATTAVVLTPLIRPLWGRRERERRGTKVEGAKSRSFLVSLTIYLRLRLLRKGSFSRISMTGLPCCSFSCSPLQGGWKYSLIST